MKTYRWAMPGVLLFASLAAAQVAGPSLGLIFDAQNSTLRPITGIPGAAMFGDSLALTNPLTSAVISARQNAAIVNDGAWKIVTLARDGSFTMTALPSNLAANAQAAISESGASAAFYVPGDTVINVVTNGSLTPINVPGALTHFAVREDGAVLASAVSADGSEGLYWLNSGQRILTMGQTSAIVVTSSYALVADAGANQIWKIQDAGNSLLASATDGLSSPTAAALTADGRALWFLNAGAASLTGIDLTTRAQLSLACNCQPSALAPLAGGMAFRLTDLASGPVWLLDAADPARLVFIPAPVSQEAAQ